MINIIALLGKRKITIFNNLNRVTDVTIISYMYGHYIRVSNGIRSRLKLRILEKC